MRCYDSLDYDQRLDFVATHTGFFEAVQARISETGLPVAIRKVSRTWYGKYRQPDARIEDALEAEYRRIQGLAGEKMPDDPSVSPEAPLELRSGPDEPQLSPRQKRQQEREAWMRERMRKRNLGQEDLNLDAIYLGFPAPDLTDDLPADMSRIQDQWLDLIRLQQREQTIRAAIAETLVYRGRRGTRNLGAHNERHYTFQELGALWGVSAKTVHRIFRAEPGVLKMPTRGRGERPRFRVPESVVERVHKQLARNVSRWR